MCVISSIGRVHIVPPYTTVIRVSHMSQDLKHKGIQMKTKGKHSVQLLLYLQITITE